MIVPRGLACERLLRFRVCGSLHAARSPGGLLAGTGAPCKDGVVRGRARRALGSAGTAPLPVARGSGAPFVRHRGHLLYAHPLRDALIPPVAIVLLLLAIPTILAAERQNRPKLHKDV